LKAIHLPENSGSHGRSGGEPRLRGVVRFGLLAIGALMLIATGMSGAAHAATDATPCAPMPAAQEAVVDVLRRMYGALQKDDLSSFQAQVTPDYYALDGGVRYTAEGLVSIIRSLHAQGFKFEWTVTETDVHVTCNQAWLSYVNKGSIEEPRKAKTPMEWVESALLEHRDGVWRIRFFHSTPVPPKH